MGASRDWGPPKWLVSFWFPFQYQPKEVHHSDKLLYVKAIISQFHFANAQKPTPSQNSKSMDLKGAMGELSPLDPLRPSVLSKNSLPHSRLIMALPNSCPWRFMTTPLNWVGPTFCSNGLQQFLFTPPRFEVARVTKDPTEFKCCCTFNHI